MAELSGKRNDVTSSVSGAILSAFYEGTSGSDTYGGGDDPDQIYGGQGDDVLSGGGGNDSLGGEIGNDTVGGDDGDDTIDGGHGNDSVSGGAGHDLVIGGEGVDTMAGGGGNDTYYLTNAGDTVVESADEGVDWLYTTQGIDLTAIAIDNVALMTSIGTAVTGNSLNNVMQGNGGDDSLSGGDGHDSLHGFNGSDSLSGGAGNDWLDGYLGDDALAGGLGDDTYYVDSASDNVVEADGEGSDTVNAAATYSLIGRAVENAILLGAGNISLTGNALNNQLWGNTGTNALDGGAGNDRLDGGAMGDIMWGRAGDDTFYVDSVSDLVEEAHGEGIDTVFTSVSYSLFGRAVEIMAATGAGNVNLTGNSLGNTLTGNSGSNVLDGAAGNDTLSGGLGDDTYYVQNTGDKVVEASGEGFDTVYASVTYTLTGRYAEVLDLTGTANLAATGNSVNNTLRGNAGDNTLNGLGGNDVLTGRGGADVFLFATGSRSDTITDFTVADGDMINVNAYTGGVANTGAVSQAGLNVVINFGGGNLITVLNASQADVLSHMVW